MKIDRQSFSGTQFALDAHLSQANEIATLVVQLPAFDAVNRIFSTTEISADFDYKGDSRTLHGKLSSPFSINYEAAPRLKLGAIVATLTGNHPLLSGEITANAKGNIEVDYAGQTAKLGLDAKIDESRFKANFSVKDFTRPVYAAEITANRLDLDRYLSGDWLKHMLDDTTPFTTAALKDVVLQGSLRAGEFKLDKFKASNLAADVRIDKSMITASPITARLYGGTLAGSINMTAHESPTISVRQSLKGLQMGALLTKTGGAGRLGGKATVELDIGTQGNTVGELRKALNGNISLAVAHGYLAGINLRTALNDGKKDLGLKNPERILPANFSDLTDFTELTSKFNLKDGKVSGTGFVMKSPLMQTAGEGEFDLVAGEMSYRLKTTISNSINRRTSIELLDLKGVTVPIHLSGSYAAPNIAFDFAAASGGNVARLAAAHAAKAEASAAIALPKASAARPAPAKPRLPAKPVKKPQH